MIEESSGRESPNAGGWQSPADQGRCNGELRGLAPGKYRVRDYAEGKDLGPVEVVAGEVPRLNTDFKDRLLLAVRK